VGRLAAGWRKRRGPSGASGRVASVRRQCTARRRTACAAGMRHASDDGSRGGLPGARRGEGRGSFHLCLCCGSDCAGRHPAGAPSAVVAFVVVAWRPMPVRHFAYAYSYYCLAVRGRGRAGLHGHGHLLES
jgi:hypothetical protein